MSGWAHVSTGPIIRLFICGTLRHGVVVGRVAYRRLLEGPEAHGAVDRGAEEAVVRRAHGEGGDPPFVAGEEAQVGVVEQGEVPDLVRDVARGRAVGRRLARVQHAQLVVLFGDGNRVAVIDVLIACMLCDVQVGRASGATHTRSK